MTGFRTCPGCGAVIRQGAPEGLCPRCLMALGMGVEPGERPGKRPIGISISQPKVFGDYELLEEIARGGMGIVFRARQRSLNRVVAVKLMLFGAFSSDTAIKRFRAEAEAAASLRHPNIVGIHEVGEEEGQHYFSMEYVEGRDLGSLSRGQPMPGRRAARYVKKIAEAVAYAHEKGVLHRDLKPSNVLVDASDEPRITDFGLAKRLDSQNGEAESARTAEQTSTGQLLGSPSYMAPEQLSRKSSAIGPPSDIYSLGALLYHLLIGRPPFLAETIETTLAQVLAGDPVSPRRLNPSIGRDLETICLKCLEREPGKRYATTKELAEELDRVLDGRPILARPVGQVQKAFRWAVRNPGVSGFAALAALLLVVFLVFSWVSSKRIREESAQVLVAKQETVSELWRSYLARARAERRSGRAGQRFDSLAAISKASAIRPSLELRNEAIAALALPDVRMVNTFPHLDTRLNICYSPTLSRYAILDASGVIRVCLANGNVELARIPALDAFPRWMGGFSSDERYLIVPYYNDKTCIWDIEERHPVFPSVPGIGGAFLPAENKVAVPGADNSLRLYSIPGGELIRSIHVSEPLQGLAVDPTSRFIGGFQHGSTAFHMVDLRNGQELPALQHPTEVGSAAFSPDGTMAAVGCYDKSVWLWNLKTNASPVVLKGHEHNIVALGFNHTGALLASGSWDNTVRLWDVAGARQLLVSDGMSYEMRFDPSDLWLAHTEYGGQAGLLELATSKELREIHPALGAHQGAWSFAMSPDGRFGATGHTDGFAIWDLPAGKEVLSVPMDACRSVLFTPDGHGLVTSGSGGLAFWPLRVLRRADADEVSVGWPHIIRQGLQFVEAVLSTDGRSVAAANRPAGSIAIYELAHPERRYALTNLDNVQFVSASPDFRWIAAGTWGGQTVKVWNVPERKVVKEFAVGGPAKVAFSPDGHLFVTAGSAYEVWRAGTWEKIYEVRKPDSESCGQLAFSPDNRWLAVVRRGREVVLVRAANGEEIASFSPPGQSLIYALTFSPDATQLIALQADQALQVWDIRSMRRELKSLKLDWDDPECSPEITNGSPVLRPVVGRMLTFSAEELSARIPIREGSVPAQLIDLSQEFNSPLTDTRIGYSEDGNDLSEMPRGLQQLAGTDFDIRGVVQLSVPGWASWYPTNVTGIKIGKPCEHLQFLHGTWGGTKEGAEIAVFVMHLSDGTVFRQPVRYGIEVRDWWERIAGESLRSDSSILAWHGSNRLARSEGVLGIRIFKTTWINPRPGSVVESMDYCSSGDSGTAPFLLAITAGP